MADEQVELASKDVFVLLGVSAPENLEIGTKRQEQGDTKGDENESVFTLDEEDKTKFMVMKVLLYVPTVIWVAAGRLVKTRIFIFWSNNRVRDLLCNMH